MIFQRCFLLSILLCVQVNVNFNHYDNIECVLTGAYRFLTKLLTEDLPRLFVRPKKIVLDFQKGKAVGPLPTDFRSGEVQEGNKDYVGELSVTLVDARKLFYVFPGTSCFSI